MGPSIYQTAYDILKINPLCLKKKNRSTTNTFLTWQNSYTPPWKQDIAKYHELFNDVKALHNEYGYKMVDDVNDEMVNRDNNHASATEVSGESDGE